MVTSRLQNINKIVEMIFSLYFKCLVNIVNPLIQQQKLNNQHAAGYWGHPLMVVENRHEKRQKAFADTNLGDWKFPLQYVIPDI